jgi:hypothetical protein
MKDILKAYKLNKQTYNLYLRVGNTTLGLGLGFKGSTVYEQVLDVGVEFFPAFLLSSRGFLDFVSAAKESF